MAIYFYGCITLDGFLADQFHGLDWLHQTGSPEETTYDDFYRRMDVTIMGKHTFNEIAKFDQPAHFYPSTINYVFTHDTSFNQPGFIAVSSDIVSFVSDLKDKNIWIVGGNQLVAPILNHNLFDEMIIQIAPVLLGKGIPLFTQDDIQKRFKLKAVRKFGQFAELHYIKK